MPKTEVKKTKGKKTKVRSVTKPSSQTNQLNQMTGMMFQLGSQLNQLNKNLAEMSKNISQIGYMTHHVFNFVMAGAEVTNNILKEQEEAEKKRKAETPQEEVVEIKDAKYPISDEEEVEEILDEETKSVVQQLKELEDS